MSHGKLGEPEGLQISDPYNTVGKIKALTKRHIRGKDFELEMLHCFQHWYRVSASCRFHAVLLCHKKPHFQCSKITSHDSVSSFPPLAPGKWSPGADSCSRIWVCYSTRNCTAKHRQPASARLAHLGGPFFSRNVACTVQTQRSY